MEIICIIFIFNFLLFKVEVELRYIIFIIVRKGFKDICFRVKDFGFIIVISIVGV